MCFHPSSHSVNKYILNLLIRLFMFLYRICCHPQWHHHKLQGAEEVPGKQYFNDLFTRVLAMPSIVLYWLDCEKFNQNKCLRAVWLLVNII